MKKLNKLVAILVAMAMVLSLTVISAFAAGIKAADEDHPATAALTKTLTAPNGVTPNDTFYFSFVQDANDETAQTIPNRSVEITAADLVTEDATSATLTYVDTFDNILTGITFPAAGVYNYTVTEVAGNPTKVVGDNLTYSYTYSQDSYTLKVGVATKANGTTYVDSIAVIKNGEKVDATDGQANDFNFTNSMTATISNVDPEGSETDDPVDNDDTALYIGKTVDLADGSAAAPAGQKFSFRLNITAPAGVTGTRVYTADIVDAEGTAQNQEDIEVTAGSNYDFQLEDGWRLVFKSIDVGAKYTVTEADYPGYAKAGEVANVYVNDQGTNGTTVTNTYDSTEDPATGLSMNNLPFIVLALVAIGGLVAYVVVRRKSEDNA